MWNTVGDGDDDPTHTLPPTAALNFLASRNSQRETEKRETECSVNRKKRGKKRKPDTSNEK